MFYKKLVINGTEYPIAVNLTGSGAPTESTEADVGMFYMDTDTGDVYKRTTEGWSGIGGGDVPTKMSEIENDVGYVKSENDTDVIVQVKQGVFPAYFKLENGSLKAYVYGYGGVDIKSNTNPVKISANKGVEISSTEVPVTIKNLATPSEATDAANKGYVDGLVGDIETALDELHTYAQALVGGVAE